MDLGITAELCFLRSCGSDSDDSNPSLEEDRFEAAQQVLESFDEISIPRLLNGDRLRDLLEYATELTQFSNDMEETHHQGDEADEPDPCAEDYMEDMDALDVGDEDREGVGQKEGQNKDDDDDYQEELKYEFLRQKLFETLENKIKTIQQQLHSKSCLENEKVCEKASLYPLLPSFPLHTSLLLLFHLQSY